MERLLGNSGDYCLLRIFGCACWPNLRPYNRHKLDFCSKQCAFLGYSNLHKGYKCLDISTGRLYIPRDIVFDETVFPFSSLHSNAGARLRDEINMLPLYLQPLNFHYHEGHELREPVDINPPNAANPPAESFLQNLDQDFASDDESSSFSTLCGRTGADSPGTAFTSGFPANGVQSRARGPSPHLDSDSAASEAFCRLLT
jgi:hypothetical protein